MSKSPWLTLPHEKQRIGIIISHKHRLPAERKALRNIRIWEFCRSEIRKEQGLCCFKSCRLGLVNLVLCCCKKIPCFFGYLSEWVFACNRRGIDWMESEDWNVFWHKSRRIKSDCWAVAATCLARAQEGAPHHCYWLTHYWGWLRACCNNG